MAYNYDKLYSETPDALGPPTKVIVQFFARLDRNALRVLDVGCGQGRDALFIARQGHRVTGVDLSPHGIRDLEGIAQQEGLDIQGVVADLAYYQPDDDYDVILIDRTLHMLARTARLEVLSRLLDHVTLKGWLLIADEASNMEDFIHIITAHSTTWTTELSERGYLFIQRD